MCFLIGIFTWCTAQAKSLSSLMLRLSSRPYDRRLDSVDMAPETPDPAADRIVRFLNGLSDVWARSERNLCIFSQPCETFWNYTKLATAEGQQLHKQRPWPNSSLQSSRFKKKHLRTRALMSISIFDHPTFSQSPCFALENHLSWWIPAQDVEHLAGLQEKTEKMRNTRSHKRQARERERE